MTMQVPLYLQPLGIPARSDRQFIADVFGAGAIDQSAMVVSSAGTPRSVSVSKGACYVAGNINTDQGSYRCFNDAVVTLVHDTATTNPRLDQIIVRVYDSTELGSGADGAVLEIVKGTETSGATLVNRNGAVADGSLPKNCERLADVLVPTGSGSAIPSANIADRRVVIKNRGKSIITAEEFQTWTAGEATSGGVNGVFKAMPTPDRVTVNLKADSLLKIGFAALWKGTSSAGGNVGADNTSGDIKANVFIDGNRPTTVSTPFTGTLAIIPDAIQPKAIGPNSQGQQYYRPLTVAADAARSYSEVLALDMDESPSSALLGGIVLAGTFDFADPDPESVTSGFLVVRGLSAGKHDVEIRYTPSFNSSPSTNRIYTKLRRLWVKAEEF